MDLISIRSVLTGEWEDEKQKEDFIKIMDRANEVLLALSKHQGLTLEQAHKGAESAWISKHMQLTAKYEETLRQAFILYFRGQNSQNKEETR